jgi:hypothetical protein
MRYYLTIILFICWNTSFAATFEDGKIPSNPIYILSVQYETIEFGKKEYLNGHYINAFTTFLKLAEQGNAEAQYNLGFMFEHGKGCVKNKLKASKWYELSAKQGYTDAVKKVSESKIKEINTKTAMDINKIRKKYPQYKDLSDKKLADAIHKKFYSDMPINQFYSKIGLEKVNPIESKENTQNIQKNNNTATPENLLSTKKNIQKENIETANNSEYIAEFLITMLILFFINDHKDKQKITSENDNSTINKSIEYKIFLILLPAATSFLLFLNIKYNENLFYLLTIASIIFIYFIYLIYQKNIKKIIMYIEDIKRVSQFQLLITLIVAFTFDKKLLLIGLIISLSLLTYHFMLSFFQNLLIIVKKENANEYSYKNYYEYNKNDNSYGQYNYKSKNNDKKKESDKSDNFKQKDNNSNNSNNENNKKNDKSDNKNSEKSKYQSFDYRFNELRSDITKCYVILDIPQNAMPIAIKTAFKRKMSNYHPDKVIGLDIASKKLAEEEAKLINVAYQTLKKRGKC